jgi:hypothetical protein
MSVGGTVVGSMVGVGGKVGRIDVDVAVGESAEAVAVNA